MSGVVGWDRRPGISLTGAVALLQGAPRTPRRDGSSPGHFSRRASFASPADARMHVRRVAGELQPDSTVKRSRGRPRPREAELSYSAQWARKEKLKSAQAARLAADMARIESDRLDSQARDLEVQACVLQSVAWRCEEEVQATRRDQSVRLANEVSPSNFPRPAYLSVSTCTPTMLVYAGRRTGGNAAAGARAGAGQDVPHAQGAERGA